MFRPEKDKHASSLTKKIAEMRLALPDKFTAAKIKEGECNEDLTKYVLNHLQQHAGLVADLEAHTLFQGGLQYFVKAKKQQKKKKKKKKKGKS